MASNVVHPSGSRSVGELRAVWVRDGRDSLPVAGIQGAALRETWRPVAQLTLILKGTLGLGVDAPCPGAWARAAPGDAYTMLDAEDGNGDWLTQLDDGGGWVWGWWKGRMGAHSNGPGGR